MVDAALLAPLLAELRSARADCRAHVFAAVASEVPAMRALPAEHATRGLTVIAAALDKGLSDEPLSSADRMKLCEVGKHWSELGIDAVTQAAVVATMAQAEFGYLSRLADRARYPRKKDRRPAVEQAGACLMQMVSSVQQALLARVPNSAARHEGAEASLVDRLLGAAPDQWVGVELEAAEAGFADGAGLVILLPGNEVGDAATGALAARLVERHKGACGSLQHDPIPHVAVLLQERDDVAWNVAVKHVKVDVADASSEMLAVRRPVPLTQLPHTYELCRSVLHFTTVLPTPSPDFDLADLHMYAVLARAPVPIRQYLFELIVGPLLDDPDKLELLDGLVAIGPYEEVEAALGRAARTTSRDVGTIKTLTGHDWNSPRGRFMLTLATHLRWLAALSLGEFSEADWGPIPRFSLLKRSP
jgi:hypothetical protein